MNGKTEEEFFDELFNEDQMTDHPNRSRAKSPASNPTPDEIFGVRINAKLTQQQAAEIVHSGLRTWQQWEAGDRRMHPALFELFLLKTGQAELVIDPRCIAAQRE